MWSAKSVAGNTTPPETPSDIERCDACCAQASPAGIARRSAAAAIACNLSFFPIISRSCCFQCEPSCRDQLRYLPSPAGTDVATPTVFPEPDARCRDARRTYRPLGNPHAASLALPLPYGRAFGDYVRVPASTAVAG